MGRITKIQQNSNDNNGPIFNIGATFENIFMSETDNFTLKNLYDQLINFFNNDKSAFTMYSDSEPINNHVKIWYDTSNSED